MIYFKKSFFLIFIAAFIIVAIGAVSYGFLPVIKVEDEYISYARFSKAYQGVQSANRLRKENPLASSSDVTKKALEQIIENKFLDIIIMKTNANLKSTARENVEKVIAESKDLPLDQAARILYGISAQDFKELVLIPSAEKDLLLKHYEYNPSELDRLWEDLSHKANIRIYYPGFEWRDGEVKIKN